MIGLHAVVIRPPVRLRADGAADLRADQRREPFDGVDRLDDGRVAALRDDRFQRVRDAPGQLAVLPRAGGQRILRVTFGVVLDRSTSSSFVMSSRLIPSRRATSVRISNVRRSDASTISAIGRRLHGGFELAIVEKRQAPLGERTSGAPAVAVVVDAGNQARIGGARHETIEIGWIHAPRTCNGDASRFSWSFPAVRSSDTCKFAQRRGLTGRQFSVTHLVSRDLRPLVRRRRGRMPMPLSEAS